MRDFPFFRSTDLWHSLGEGRGSVKRGGEKRGANLTARTRHVRLGLPFSEKKSFTRSSLARFKWIWGQSWKHDTQHTPISRGNANQFSEYCFFSVFILHFNFLRSLRPIYLSLRDQYTWHFFVEWILNCKKLYCNKFCWGVEFEKWVPSLSRHESIMDPQITIAALTSSQSNFMSSWPWNFLDSA